MDNKSNRTKKKDQPDRNWIVSSLQIVPPGVATFKKSLEDANAEMLREALENIPEENNKSRIKILTAKLNSLEKTRPKALREDLEERKNALEEKGWEIDVENRTAYKKFGQFESIDIGNAVSVEHLFSQAEAQELAYSKNSDDSDGNGKTVSPVNAVQLIHTGKIVESPFEPQQRRREKFKTKQGADGIKELAESILADGLQQPILVRPIGTHFEIVFGERRFLAHLLKGIREIHCFVKDLSDADVIKLQYIENHNRLEPDPLDDAFTFSYLKTEKNYSVHDLAIEFKMSEANVLRRLKLNDLIPEAKKLLSEKILPLGHGVYMANFSADVQKKIIDDEMAFSYEGAEAGNALTLAEFKRDVEMSFVRKLADAPFDISDERLHAKGLICPNCTQRTGFEPKLYDDDLEKNDTCLNKSCFEMKTNVNLRIKQAEIAEQNAATASNSDESPNQKPDEKFEKELKAVPLVTTRSAVNKKELPIKGEILTNQEILDEPGCEFSVLSLDIDKGRKVYVCKNDKCPTHHPEKITPVDGDAQNNRELQSKEQKFGEKVRKSLREKAFAEAVKVFTDTNVIWQYNDLISEILYSFWKSQAHETRNFIATLCKDWKNLPKDNFNKEQIRSFVESLDKEKQSRLLFIFAFIEVGMFSNSDPAELKEFIVRFTNFHYLTLDAETRLELAPEEFQDLANLNLQYVKNGRLDEVKNFWWNEPKKAD